MKRKIEFITQRFLCEQKIVKEEAYGFKTIPIEVTQDNYNEALKLREKFSAFTNIGIGTFLSNTFLWRAIDQKEFNIIKSTGKITGGEYSVEPERYFGASFGGSRSEVLNFGLRAKKNGRYEGNLYLIGIQAEDKEFLNLNMTERWKDQGFEYEVGDYNINSKLGDVGLGFSVRDVTLRDVLFVYLIADEGERLIDITDEVI